MDGKIVSWQEAKDKRDEPIWLNIIELCYQAEVSLHLFRLETGLDEGTGLIPFPIANTPVTRRALAKAIRHRSELLSEPDP